MTHWQSHYNVPHLSPNDSWDTITASLNWISRRRHTEHESRKTHTKDEDRDKGTPEDNVVNTEKQRGNRVKIKHN